MKFYLIVNLDGETELEAHFIARRRGLHGYKVIPESVETWDSAAEFEAWTLQNHGYN